MQLLMPELKSMNFYRQTSKERKKKRKHKKKGSSARSKSWGKKKKNSSFWLCLVRKRTLNTLEMSKGCPELKQRAEVELEVSSVHWLEDIMRWDKHWLSGLNVRKNHNSQVGVSGYHRATSGVLQQCLLSQKMSDYRRLYGNEGEALNL